MNGPYFVGASGGKHYYVALAALIKALHPQLRGAHIFQQLDALGLRTEFDRGITPIGLPYSFTKYEETDPCFTS